MTLISSVPNILVSLVAGISFLEFLIYSIPLSLVVMIITFQILIRLFKIKKPISNEQKNLLREKVSAFDEWSVVEDKNTFYRSISVMIITLVLLASADFFGIGLGLIAIVGAVMMLLVSHVDTEKILHKIDWSVIFFVSSLLILVGGLSEGGILQTFSEPLIQLASSNLLLVIIIVLWIVGLASSVIVDIPLTAAFIPIVEVITNNLGSNSILLWWAIIFGVSLGANFTPLGSSSTIIALGILRKQQKVSFKEFSKIGFIVCTIQLVLGSIYLVGLYLLFPT